MVNSLKMQPTFQVDLPIGADDAIKKIGDSIRTRESLKYAKAAGHCADFSVDPAQRRFWSPHLSIQVSDTETGSQLFGRFSPRPEIWTFFMFIYFVMACLIFGGAVWGYVQWFMNDRPWALMLVPISILVIVMLHFASLIGQGLSRDQMEQLRTQLDETLSPWLPS
ncbi:hypothetical protein [Novipirellula artificiosorum]|uniref:Uncharacterized protein n=1 Tax=Novipirellula artificiosorum TaxID=2528016 RepID=A0A5C6DNU7_9BACT|nr:hypothetical protein [Novipirellula artificiosorum]TWU38398.1 hypothetical protein Poly41_28740 [Novipirellula artificiosorum]